MSELKRMQTKGGAVSRQETIRNKKDGGDTLKSARKETTSKLGAHGTTNNRSMSKVDLNVGGK